jgi:GntR family transcriptional regulator, vanillate catabolism transcriptional regulator
MISTQDNALEPVSSSESAQARALLQLRELILSGDLPGGQRIAELAVVQRLGMSRTPIRAALQRLEQEGLLSALSGGGFVVKSFSESDIFDAIELRGTLEGLQVRRAAERGVAVGVLTEARQCLEQIDEVLGQSSLTDEAWSNYVRLNEHFHALLTELCNSPVIAHQLERVLSLPFASASAFVVSQANTRYARDMLIVAQDQHRQVLDAIAQGEGARAEAIMREHSRLAQRNLREVLKGDSGHPTMQKVINLLRRKGSPR